MPRRSIAVRLLVAFLLVSLLPIGILATLSLRAIRVVKVTSAATR